MVAALRRGDLDQGGAPVNDEYLPEVYLKFRSRYPEVAGALDALGKTADGAGPLDERTARLVKLGLAIGGSAEGSVRSNARKALAAGASPEDVRHVALLAITTCGFPAAIAGVGWVDEVLADA
jgi:4-carboxymuconolactone decarboxylase